MRFLAIILILFASTARARWLEATSTNFIVYSDGRETQLREFTDKLERFDQVLRYMTRTEAEPSPLKVKVYLLASRRIIADIYPGNQPNIGGFYKTSMLGPMAFVPRMEGSTEFDLDGEKVLYHEYAHHFMSQYYPAAYPSWYVEGFAEYFSTTDFRKSGVHVGKVAMQRLPSLAWEKWLPLERLLTLTYQEQQKISTVDMGQLYAQGWLLTHYLFNTPERKGQLGLYCKNLNTGMPIKEAFETAFKTDYEGLGKDLRTYYKTGRLIELIIKPELFKAMPVVVRTLSDAEGALVLPEAQLRIGLAKEKRQDFNKKFAAVVTPLLSTDAGRLAQAEWELAFGEPGKVFPLLETLLKATPADPRALTLQANAAFKLSLTASPENRAAAIKTARSWAVKANRAAPDTPLPLVLFYLSFREDENGPNANALAGLERARDLLPQDEYLAFLNAVAVARVGRKEDARAYLRPFMNNPHGGSMAAAAQSLMKQIDSGAQLGMPIDMGEEG